MNLLSPFGWLYGRVANLRNALYDRGVNTSHPLGARTVSIGNITVGGTGKTPLVILAAKILAGSGERVCVLTRGYGRKDPGKRVLVSDRENILVDARTGGDEPVEIARRLIGKAVVIADADRVSAAEWAREKFDITAFVLDDGFQHRRAKRDLDIVCIDATDPFGGGKVLPAARLREPLSNLRRADAFVITRADLSDNIKDLRSKISHLNPDVPIFQSENRIASLKTLQEFHANTESAEGAALDVNWKRLCADSGPANADGEVRVMAFCALGNPDSFFALIDAELTKPSMDKFRLHTKKQFPDHHAYRQSDIRLLEKQAAEHRISAFMTTAKDAVKLIDLKFEIPCFVVEIEPAITEMDDFRSLITVF